MATEAQYQRSLLIIPKRGISVLAGMEKQLYVTFVHSKNYPEHQEIAMGS